MDENEDGGRQPSSQQESQWAVTSHVLCSPGISDTKRRPYLLTTPTESSRPGLYELIPLRGFPSSFSLHKPKEKPNRDHGLDEQIPGFIMGRYLGQQGELWKASSISTRPRQSYSQFLRHPLNE